MFSDEERKFVGKLVRDLVPSLIAADGRAASVRVLGDEEYDQALLQKLMEEAHEVCEAITPEQRLEEAADVYEVLLALLSKHGHDSTALTMEAARKREARGAFAQRLFWEPGNS